MEPSTIHGYRKVYQKHVEGKPIKAMQINRITAKDGQDWLNSLPQSLSHKTHLRARAFLSGVFTVALQSNVITGVNPMSSTKAGGMSKGRKAGDLTARELKIRVSNGHAYDHAEIALMLELPEPARTICAVAAFTGLSRSEIPALKWEDYKDGERGHSPGSATAARDIGEVSEGPKLPSGGRWLDVLRVEREEARRSPLTWITCRGERFHNL